MTDDRRFDDLEGRGPLGEFTREMNDVSDRLMPDAVTSRAIMTERVADDPVGRDFDEETRSVLVEWLVRAARQRDEPST